MDSAKLQNASHWATIVAAAAAVMAFSVGYSQYYHSLLLQNETIQLEREAQAIDLFIKYNELMRPASSNGAESQDAFWRHNLAITIAESIFKLTREEKGWNETVAWMLFPHVQFLKEPGLNCETFDPEFVRFAEARLQQSVCRRR